MLFEGYKPFFSEKFSFVVVHLTFSSDLRRQSKEYNKHAFIEIYYDTFFQRAYCFVNLTLYLDMCRGSRELNKHN